MQREINSETSVFYMTETEKAIAIGYFLFPEFLHVNIHNLCYHGNMVKIKVSDWE